METEAEEPVMVFVRIRPEMGSMTGTLSKTMSSSTLNPMLSGSWSSFPSPSMHSIGGFSIDSNHPRCILPVDDKTVRLVAPESQSSRKPVSAVDDKIYTFDKIFPEPSTQEDIYRSVSSLVKATVRGYNTTIFAYGCTGSGKSFTMTGNSSAPGIIPRAISEIFSIIEETASQEKDVFFYVRISYVELYNNAFRNLLDFASKELAIKEPESKKITQSIDTHESSYMDSTSASTAHQIHPQLAHRSDKIEVRESQTAGVFLAGPSLRIPVTTAKEAFQLIAKGNKFRATGSTQCNDESSRSHAILTVHVESRAPSSSDSAKPGPNGSNSELRLGKMHLVDLAGSERVALSGAEGSTLVETQNINLSLTALGDVLQALSRNATIMNQQGKGSASQKGPSSLVPVPYRNSKLTHLLKDSLGGNSKTIMIATIRNLPDYYQQTLISLMYASRAKKVKNRSLINRNVIGDTGIMAVTTEIERLKSRLEERQIEFESLRHVQLQDATEKANLKARLEELTKANELEKQQLEMQMSHVIHSQAGQLALQREKINSLQSSLQEELMISQNRIVEQEREINWLKKELEQSSKQMQPSNEMKQQMEKMSSIISSTQNESSKLRNDLISSSRENDSLRAQISILQSQIKSLESQNRSLTDKLSDKSNEIETLSNTLATTTSHLQIVSADKTKLASELASVQDKYKTLMSDLNAKANANEHGQALLETLENQLKLQSDEIKRLQNQIKSNGDSHQERILKLENERNDLRLKLSNTVTMLEKKTSTTIDEVTNKWKTAEERAKLANEQATQQLKTIASLQDEIKQLQSNSLTKSHQDSVIAQLQTELSLLKNELKVSNENLESLTSSNISLNEEFIRCQSQLQFEQQRSKDVQSMSSEQLTQIKSQQQQLHDRYDSEYKKKMQDLSKKHQEELQIQQESLQRSFEMKTNAMIAKHQEELLLHQQKLIENSEECDSQMKELEKTLRLEFDKETKKRIHDIESSYSSSLQRLKEDSEKNLLSLQNMKEKQIESELTNQLESLRISHQQEILLLKQSHASNIMETINKLRNELNQSHREDIKRLEKSILDIETQKQEEIERLKSIHRQELEYTLDTVVKTSVNTAVERTIDKALEEQRNELESKHQQIVREMQSNHQQEVTLLQESINHQKDQFSEQLKAAIHKTKSQIESKYKEKLKTLSDQEELTNQKMNELLKETEQRLQKELEISLESIRSQHQEEIQDMQRQREMEFERQSSQHQEELRRSQQRYDEEMKSKQSLQQELHQWEMKYDRDLQQRQNEWELQYDQRIQSIQEIHRNQINLLEVELKQSHQREISRQQDRYLNEIEAIRKQYSNDLNDRETAMTLLRQEMEEKYDTKLKGTITELQRQIVTSNPLNGIAMASNMTNPSFESMTNAMESSDQTMPMISLDVKPSYIKSFQQTWQNKINEIQEKYKQDLIQQRDALNESHGHAKELLNKELYHLRSQYQDLLSSMQSKQSLESSKQKESNEEFYKLLESSLADRDEHYQRIIASMEENAKTEKQQYLAMIDRLKSQFEEEKAVQQEQREMEMKKEEYLLNERFRQELAEKENQLVHQHRSYVQDLLAKHSKVVSDLTREKSSLESKLSTSLLDQTLLQQEQQFSLTRLKSSIESDKRQEIDKLKQELQMIETQNKRELMALEQKHHEELQSMRSENEKAIQSIHRQHQEEIKAVEGKWREKMQTIQQNADQKQESRLESLAMQLQDLQQQLKALNQSKSSLESQKEELQRRFDEQTNQLAGFERKQEDYEQQIQGMTREYQKQVEELNQRCQSMASNRDDLYQELQSQHETEMKRLKLYHHDETERLRDELAAKHSMQMKVIEQDMARLKDELMNQLHSSHQTDIVTIRSDHDTEMESIHEMIQSLKQQHEQDLSNLVATHNVEIETMKQQQKLSQMMEIFHMKQQLESEYHIKITQLEDSLGLKQKESDDSIELMRQQTEEIISNLHREYQQEYQLKEQSYQQAISLSHQEEINQKEIEWNLLKESMAEEYQSKHTQAMKQLTNEYEELIRSIRKQSLIEADRNLLSLQHENQAMQSLLQTQRERNQELETTIDQMTKYHAIEYEQLQQEKEQQIELIREQLTQRLNETMERNDLEIKDLRESNELEINRLRLEYETNHEKAMFELRNQSDQELESLSTQLRLSHEKYDNDLIIYQKHIEELSDELGGNAHRLSDSNQQINELQAANNQLEERLQFESQKHEEMIQNLKRNQENEMKRFISKYKETELKRLQIQHDIELHEVSDEIAKLHVKVDALLIEKESIQKKYQELKSLKKKQELENKEHELLLKTALIDRERNYQDDLKRALNVQQQELQGGYLTMLQQQVDGIMKLIQSHNQVPNRQVAQEEFMKMLQKLPEIWKEKYGIRPHFSEKSQPIPLNSYGSAAMAEAKPSSSSRKHDHESQLKYPTSMRPFNRMEDSQLSHDDRSMASNSKERPSDAAIPATPSMDRSNVSMNSIMATPLSSYTDKLIAAILDGDVQGIRSIVRVKGEDLVSDYWRDIARTILPIHRAISGLHLHGSEKLLLGTINCLHQLGIDVNLSDQVGDTALHRAIAVCTSKSVAAVVQSLLVRGADPNKKNNQGESPLLLECRKLRSASIDVIEALLRAQADINHEIHYKSTSSSTIKSSDEITSPASALSIVIERGFAMNAAVDDSDRLLDKDHGPSNPLLTPPPSNDGLKAAASKWSGSSDGDTIKRNGSGRRLWMKAADLLIRSGAKWSLQWRDKHGRSLLHVLVMLFSCIDDSDSSHKEADSNDRKKEVYAASYVSILQHAIQHGRFDVNVLDNKGRNIVFTLCEQLAGISHESCPKRHVMAAINAVLASSSYRGQGRADRDGKTIFDIEELASNSYLPLCLQLIGEYSQNPSTDRSLSHIAMGSTHNIGGNSYLSSDLMPRDYKHRKDNRSITNSDASRYHPSYR